MPEDNECRDDEEQREHEEAKPIDDHRQQFPFALQHVLVPVSVTAVPVSHLALQLLHSSIA